MSHRIRVAIAGYGSLTVALKQRWQKPDMRLVGVFSRRDPVV